MKRAGEASEQWSCAACTFLNSYSLSNCEICDTRRYELRGGGGGGAQPGKKKAPTKRIGKRQKSDADDGPSSPTVTTAAFSSTSTTTTTSSSSSSSSSSSIFTDDIEDLGVALPLEERVEFRRVLLEWYRANRRRLPWRGDPPPYGTAADGDDGASGGKASSKGKKKWTVAACGNNATGAAAVQQPKISSFFQNKSVSSGAEAAATAPVEGPAAEAAAEAPRQDERSTVSAYQTWVSEIMLQQTRVETVVDYYTKWMRLFPTVAELAAATPEEVNAAWAGLGYYRRARALHEGAKTIVDELGGELPSTAEELQRRIKGVGPYTAGAVASIAYGQPAPVVDGNVVRVFARLHAMDHPPAATAAAASSSSSSSTSTTTTTSALENEDVTTFRDPAQLLKPCWSLAEGLLDRAAPGDFNQALMELGATVCTPRGARCGDCPVASHCRAIRLVQSGALDDVHRYPGKAEKKPPKEVRLLVCVVVANSTSGSGGSSSERFLLVQRPAKGLLAGQWEFPSVEVEVEAEGAAAGSPSKVLSDAAARLSALLSQDLGCGDGVVWELEREMANSGVTDGSNDYDVDEDAKSEAPAVAKPFLSSSSSASPPYSSERGLRGPVVHLFSHQRHTMHIVVCRLSGGGDGGGDRGLDLSSGSRTARWMDEQQMTKVGVTTGMKKVLSTATAGF